MDLPGFTKTSVANQSADICQQIENLNIPIMQNPNTIILAIHDATQDIANSSALQMALREDVDPNGERTVCVLTKLDNLVANSDKDKVVKKAVLSIESTLWKYFFSAGCSSKAKS